MFQSRTHTCNELRLADAGKQVKIVGWMENVREVGANFAFVVVRDFYGTTQVVIETAEMLQIVKSVNKESTIAVTGTVRERASKNPKLATGEIEVVPEKIEILGRCRHNELPFEINRSRDADEMVRLKYRYLDLRNPAVKNNIVLRCNVVAALRQAMTAHGFLEITTPILTASSPEGARDYLVPARKHPGKFYALPQAPQQFKQLLMTAGFDRYFQIAPCFRDEDARGDRSPGEFYQLDMEMAFADQDDVFAVLEDVLPPIFAKYGAYHVASDAPFRRIAYRDAMDRYGSDKPDLRIDLEVQDMTALVAGSEFAPFAAGNTVKAIVVPDCSLARKAVDKLCNEVEVQAGNKPYWFKVDESGNFAGGISKFLTEKQAEITAALGLTPGCFVGVTAGKKLVAQKTAGVLRAKLGAAVPGHMDKERYEFCWIVDFPMYEIGEESGELELGFKGQLLKGVDLFRDMDMIGIRNISLVRNARDHAEPLLQALGEFIGRGFQGGTIEAEINIVLGLPGGAGLVHMTHDLQGEGRGGRIGVGFAGHILHALIQPGVAQRDGGIAAVEQLVDGLALGKPRQRAVLP